MSELGFDIDSSMRDTLEEINEYNEEQPTEPTEEFTEAVEPETESFGRERDEQGRFKAKEGDEVIQPPVEEPEPEAAIQPDTPPVGEQAFEDFVYQDVPANVVNPPSTWRPAAKAEWDKIPPVIREEMKKRELDFVKGLGESRRQMEEFGQKEQEFNRMQEIMRPYEPLIKAEGGTPETVVESMLNSAYVLRQGSIDQKVMMTLELAQQYGFLNELGSSLVSGSLPQAPMQPQAPAGLTAEQVEQMVNQRLEAEREQADSSRISSDIQQFAESVDENGRLKYPYFENVRGMMANLLESTTSEIYTLEDAYNEALWSHPETRQILLSERQHQEQANKHRQAAEKAAANNLDIEPAYATEQPNGPTGSIEDTMKAQLEAIKSRSA